MPKKIKDICELFEKSALLVSIYIYKRMNVDYVDEETDRILAKADIADERGPMPEKDL